MTSIASTTSLHVTGLTAGYREGAGLWSLHRRIIIDRINLVVAPGEIVGIVGPNGSGKSTLLRAIIDASYRFGGNVTLGDKPLSEGEIAYMPQAPAGTISPWLKVWEEISLPLRIAGQPRNECQRAAESRMQNIGISLPLQRNVQALSGGQRTRVALLRALTVQFPKVAIFDEPFEGLDAGTRNAVYKAIRSLAVNGTPVIVTSHRESDLKSVGARLLKLEGRPVRQLIEFRSDSSLEVQDESSMVSLYTESTPDTQRLLAEPRTMGLLWRYRLIGIASGLVVWSGLALIVGNSGLLPPPWSVAQQMAGLLISTELLNHLLATIARSSTGWIVANIAAVPMGILLGYDLGIFQAVSPWLAIGRAMPVFVLVASAAGLFPRLPEFQRWFLIFLTLFLIAVQAVSVGAAMAPRRRLDLARVFGASRWYCLSHVLFYEAIGGIFSGLEVTLPLALVITIVVETFLLPETGLGRIVFEHLNDSNLSLLFALVLLPAIIFAIGLAAIRRLSRRFRYEL